jgi:hypothetical protein
MHNATEFHLEGLRLEDEPVPILQGQAVFFFDLLAAIPGEGTASPEDN